MLKTEPHALLEQVADLLCPYPKSCPSDVQQPTALPTEQYEAMLDMREKLCKAALGAVRALLEYDRTVLARYYAEDSAGTVVRRGLAEAVRACAPLVKYKSDWAALFMLCRERGMCQTETQLANLIAATVPDALLPSKQNLQSGQWDTSRQRFPNWPVGVVKDDKYRRYYAIAAAAQKHL